MAGTSWPTTPMTGEERAEMLAPYGRAWRKIVDAFQKKITALDDEELEQLILACTEGRWLHDLSGDSYAAAGEVERQARAEKSRRAAEGK